jgi:hypothetical protein
MIRRLLGVSVALVLAAGIVPTGADPIGKDGCSAGDRPETGVQGQVPLADQVSHRSQQGYSCNIRPVGSNDVNGRGGDTQMTWYGDCAYQSSSGSGGDGVGVIDVRDPRRPRLVMLLQDPSWAGQGGVLGIHEGLTVNPQRGILVVPIGTSITTYDVRDCTRPKKLSHYDFGLPPDVLKSLPEGDFGIHSGKLSPDGTLYYATDIGNGAVTLTGPCLTVIDLRDARHPKLVTRWQPETACHDLSLSPDGRTAYVGYYQSGPGHPAAVVGAFTPAPAAHPLSGLRIVDVSQVQAHRAAPALTVLGEIKGGRQHTETVTRIGRRTYVVAGEEGSCPGGNARIVDVTDPRHPVQTAEVPLAVNQLENCALYRADSDGADNLLLYTSHYISVDDPANAHLAFITWYSSGLRVFDIRDPFHPREVAYVNPAVGSGASSSHDSSTTYTRYLPRTGQIWFGSAIRGLNVVELAPRLRPAGRGVSRAWSVPAPGLVTAPAKRFDLASLMARKGVDWDCTASLHH